MDIPEGDVVLRARFDPDLRRYWYWQGAILLACSFIGIPLLPFWFLGLGRWYGEQAYGNLEAVLSGRPSTSARGSSSAGRAPSPWSGSRTSPGTRAPSCGGSASRGSGWRRPG